MKYLNKNNGMYIPRQWTGYTVAQQVVLKKKRTWNVNRTHRDDADHTIPRATTAQCIENDQELAHASTHTPPEVSQPRLRQDAFRDRCYTTGFLFDVCSRPDVGHRSCSCPTLGANCNRGGLGVRITRVSRLTGRMGFIGSHDKIKNL